MNFDYFIISSEYKILTNPSSKILITNDESEDFPNITQDPGIYILDLKKEDGCFCVTIINKLSGVIENIYVTKIIIDCDNLNSSLEFQNITRSFGDLNYLLLKLDADLSGIENVINEASPCKLFSESSLNELGISFIDKLSDLRSLPAVNISQNGSTNEIRLIPDRQIITKTIIYLKELILAYNEGKKSTKDVLNIIDSIKDKIDRNKTEIFSENSNVYALIDQNIMEGLLYKINFYLHSKASTDL